MKRIILGTSPDETQEIAQKIGGELRVGEIVVLISDLGGGKTTFVQGLTEGAGSKDDVSSPTFTISQVYNARKLQIHHYDLYRLGSQIGIMMNEIQDVISDPKNVCAIEWPEGVMNELGHEKVVRIELRMHKNSETDREIVLSYPERLDYLFTTLEDKK